MSRSGVNNNWERKRSPRPWLFSVPDKTRTASSPPLTKFSRTPTPHSFILFYFFIFIFWLLFETMGWQPFHISSNENISCSFVSFRSQAWLMQITKFPDQATSRVTWLKNIYFFLIIRVFSYNTSQWVWGRLTEKMI